MGDIMHQEEIVKEQHYRGANYEDVDMDLENEEFYQNYKKYEEDEQVDNNDFYNLHGEEPEYDLVDEDEISIIDDDNGQYDEQKIVDNQEKNTVDTTIEGSNVRDYLPVRENRGNWKDRFGEDYVTFNITISSAKEKFGEDLAKKVVHQELQQMLDK